MTCHHLTSDRRCGLGVARGINGGPIPLVVCDSCAQYNGPLRSPPTAPVQVRWDGCGCVGPTVSIVRWMFIDWYGVPRFLRVNWLPRGFYPGCGCMVRLKDWWLEVGRWQLFGLTNSPTHVSATP